MASIEVLPDDILLHIFSFLKSWSLLNIIETCSRFEKVGKDKSLWNAADFSDGHLSACQILRRVICCLHSNTKKIYLRGNRKNQCQQKWKTDLLTPNLLEKISLSSPQLNELILNEAVIDGRKLKITNFKCISALKKLSLINCEIINLPIVVSEGSYFKNINKILPNLEFLEISYCGWIQDYDLMVLSKLDYLKTLILKCDIRIGVTMAYLAISFRFGFKSLEVLDMRGTSLQNSDIQSIVQNGKLKSLHLGPIGSVKRMNDEPIDEFNLVIPDPNRREEPKQQVVVINMGPDGPYWSHAKEEELDQMGLHWVKKGLNKSKREDSLKDDDHYFVGKEGKLIKAGEVEDSPPPGENSKGERKRKLSHEDENEAHKRFKNDDNPEYCDALKNNPTDGSNEHKNSEVINGVLPDEGLSDLMVHSFRVCTKLSHLCLEGCAITNAGLQELIQLLPMIQFIDVTNTLVSEEGINSAQVLRPNCIFKSREEFLPS